MVPRGEVKESDSHLKNIYIFDNYHIHKYIFNLLVIYQLRELKFSANMLWGGSETTQSCEMHMILDMSDCCSGETLHQIKQMMMGVVWFRVYR